MLRQRVLTALVLMPLVVGGILYLDNNVFAVVLAVVLLVAAREFGQLAHLGAGPRLFIFVAVIGLSMALASTYLTPVYADAFQWVMAAWWVLVSITLFARRTALARIEGVRPAILLLSGLVLLAAWLATVRLHGSGDHGPVLALYLFVLIWVADSGAYFAGRAFGVRKISPHVSPGKTWMGVAGALLGAIVCAVALAVSGFAGELPVAPLVGLSMLVTLISIGGDLWISRLKREAGVKDSGSLLPGHGGLLDRIDSLLAAAPVFAAGLGWLGVVA
jgi:phosphatidate cytidylyltransferase